MTLIEGLVSATVLLVGMLGALQGIMAASQQNALAGRIARATSVAAQIRQGIERHGRTRLRLTTGLLGDASKCVPIGSVPAADLPLLDGLDALPTSTYPDLCVVDLDVQENSASVSTKLVTGYDAKDYSTSNPNKSMLRRLLLVLPGSGGAPDVITVIVSVKDMTRRIAVKQYIALYDPSAATGNGAGVDL